MSFNVGKIKTKKSSQKVQKLKDFTSNSYSYLQVILFQCKIILESSGEKPSSSDQLDLERLVAGLLSDSQQELVRANSLKMVFCLLREKNNMYPHLQQKVLKRFIEKQTAKLKELDKEDSNMQMNSESVHELLAALKELTEIS